MSNPRMSCITCGDVCNTTKLPDKYFFYCKNCHYEIITSKNYIFRGMSINYHNFYKGEIDRVSVGLDNLVIEFVNRESDDDLGFEQDFIKLPAVIPIITECAIDISNVRHIISKLDRYKAFL